MYQYADCLLGYNKEKQRQNKQVNILTLNELTEIPLKRGREKQNHNFPIQNQQKQTTYN